MPFVAERYALISSLVLVTVRLARCISLPACHWSRLILHARCVVVAPSGLLALKQVGKRVISIPGLNYAHDFVMTSDYYVFQYV